jgi:hypothetical protein
MDMAAGFAAPEDCSVLAHLRTAEAAIECGLKISGTECIAEGLELLRSAIKRLETK